MKAFEHTKIEMRMMLNKVVKVTLPKAPWKKDHDAEKGENDYADLDDGNEDEAMKDAADKKQKAQLQ